MTQFFFFRVRAGVIGAGVIVAHLLGGAPSPAFAQQVLSPAINYGGPRHTKIHSTPAEALANLSHEAQRTESQVIPPTAARYPKDSLRNAAEQRARAWFTALQQTPVKGMQMDAYGLLAVSARQDEAAQRQIAARLATPGLSLADRAHTLQLAVSSFASVDYPERLPLAERYLKQLDALGSDVALQRMNARKPLIDVYYQLGRGDDVARLGMQLFALLDRVPFEWREDAVYYPGIGYQYAALIDALSGKPQGRDTIRALNRWLLANAVAPREYVARDSFFLYIAEQYRGEMRVKVEMSERVGEQGTPLVANYWANRGPTHDSQTVAVNDGKIRVIEIGSWGCPGCIAAVPGLERLHHRYPAVEFNFMTWGEGTWGNRSVPPEVEAERLAEHFTKKLGATFPIGIAMASRRVATEDGGVARTISTPTWQADNYPQPCKPTFYILDGHGKIRRVIGGYSRDLEENIASVIEFLQREIRS
jgi:hypothetical protein